MLRACQLSFVKVLCFVWLSWSCAVWAITLGSPQLQSKAGQPLRVEIPILVGVDEQGALVSLKASTLPKASYERLGISQKILDLNPQISIYRNSEQRLVVLVETLNVIPVADDPFLDVLVNLSWSSGSISKTFTLLLGDAQKVLVKPGQTLSEIAAMMAPQLDGATLDQAMMALYKANPDAFASGSINRLAAGTELNKPSQALLRSISPAEANQFVAESNAQWHAEQGANGSQGKSKASNGKIEEVAPKDRLKIGSSADGNEQERRYTEELVAQERQLEQAKARVAELEKNVADLQRLLDKSKEKKVVENNFGVGGFGPAVMAISLIALTGMLLWGFARYARRSELANFSSLASHDGRTLGKPIGAHSEIPERAKAILSSIDLDLSLPAAESPKTSPITISNPLVDTLRVKLNLARAYITIEDFSAAKKSLEEILRVSHSVEPSITIEAQGLLAEISHRNA
jgi:pilus assembly protein FimV